MVIVLSPEISGLVQYSPRYPYVSSSAPQVSQRQEHSAYRGPARDFEQLCRAFALVHDRYLQLGYMEQHESGMRYSLLNLLPQSTTFVVEEGTRISGTLSVVVDSPAGLPGSKEFGAEFDKLRGQGKFIAEATMFACREESAKNFDVSLQLMTVAFKWCIEIGIDELCMIVNPRHVGFYEKILGFRRMGEVQSMGHVEGNAGIMLRCDVSGILKGEANVTKQGARLLKATETLDILAFHRFQLLEPEVSVLLDFCPELLLLDESPQREMIEHCYPLASASVKENFGYVPSLEDL